MNCLTINFLALEKRIRGNQEKMHKRLPEKYRDYMCMCMCERVCVWVSEWVLQEICNLRQVAWKRNNNNNENNNNNNENSNNNNNNIV